MRRIAVVVLAIAAALAAAGPTAASAPRIVGGAPTGFAAWPWQVAILDAYRSSSFDGHICGGTLIAPDTVLTAAHCLYDGAGGRTDLGDLDVLSGASILGGAFGDRSPVVSGVVPGYHDDLWSADDLAVLRVQHTSPRAIPLPPATFAQWFAFRLGARVTVAGWGACHQPRHGGGCPHRLKQYAGIVRAKSRGFLLVRSLTSSACFGDSGGPVVGRDAAGAPYLVGVVHAGRRDCAPGHAVMFVNVAAQQRFVQAALAPGAVGGAGS